MHASPRTPFGPALAAALLATAIAGQAPALKGLDPVLLCKGESTPGRPELTAEHGTYTYCFASEANRAAFRAEPARYEIQFGGGCGRMGPLSGTGDPDRFAVHAERIYIFASDQCRASFEKRPGLFVEAPVAAPKPTAEQAAHGQELLRAACTAHGGVQAIRALRSYRYDRTAVQGDTTETWRTQVAFPDSVREDHDIVQGDKQWNFSRVTSPAAAFFLEMGKPRPMHASARTEAEQVTRRDPLLVLRAALDGKPVVSGPGKATVDGIAVDQLVIWLDGWQTTLGLGPDGRVRTAAFRGRGPQLWFGEVVLTFDDCAQHGSVIVPTSVRGTFDGKPAPSLSMRREHIEVDVPLAADAFTAPR